MSREFLIILFERIGGKIEQQTDVNFGLVDNSQQKSGRLIELKPKQLEQRIKEKGFDSELELNFVKYCLGLLKNIQLTDVEAYNYLRIVFSFLEEKPNEQKNFGESLKTELFSLFTDEEKKDFKLFVNNIYLEITIGSLVEVFDKLNARIFRLQDFFNEHDGGNLSVNSFFQNSEDVFLYLLIEVVKKVHQKGKKVIFSSGISIKEFVFLFSQEIFELNESLDWFFKENLEIKPEIERNN